MRKAPSPEKATVFTYLTLRKAVGGIAVLLPFAVSIPWWFICHHALESSISGYYYTGMRNLFVGSLCGIAMFLLCCCGFDSKDEIAGRLAALFALGVAFCPTTPDNPSPFRKHVGWAHYGFAALLFLTLAYFCLFLFTMTAKHHLLTRRKLIRNKVYNVCGCLIVAMVLAIAVTKILELLKHTYTILGLGPVFCFEALALVAFGFAWLTKGETFLKDEATEVSAQHLEVPIAPPLAQT
jgi:hypothetical protein